MFQELTNSFASLLCVNEYGPRTCRLKSRNKTKMSLVAQEPDFLSVELRGGQVLVQFDLGSGALQLASDGSAYSDGDWHSLLLKRNGTRATLKLDGSDGKTAYWVF